MSMEMNKALDLLRGLVSEVERKTCGHEETHRGGAIWEICDSCGAKWADDEGGKPEFAWPESVEKARAFLATHPAVEQACWDERKLSDLGNELHNLSCSIVHENEKLAEQIGGIARELWNLPQARAALEQPSPAQARSTWPKLEKPAQVGGVRFSAGVSSRLVVEAAQRLYEFESTPEKEAERIERLQAFREQLDPLNLAPHAKAFNEAPAEALKPEQAEAERPEVVAVMESNGAGGKRLAQRFPIVNVFVGDELMTVAQHERIVGELRAVIAQLRQHKNDYMDSGQQTYRALQNEIREREAEIARLDGLVSGRTAERDAALAEVERLRESKGDPSGSFDRCMKMMYERDENAKRLDAALARVAELEAKLAELEKQEPVSTEHLPMHIAYARAKHEVFLGSCQEDVFRFALIDLLQESPLYAAPVAQAQHCVPELLVRAEDFVSGFEDDDEQEGVSQLLADLRIAIGRAN